MIINNFIIQDFKPFNLSGVKRLELTPTKQLQLFIGDNGSGKSSLLNELIPNAAIKPMYGKRGYKQIHITHNDSEFILTSDFSQSGGAHSFVMDGTELNISGIASIQNELVEHYLGYTSLVYDITHYQCRLCSMTKTERKNLLLSINPVDLTLVTEKHKYISSKIRECKANLVLLYKKKQELEIQLLSPQLLEQNRLKVKELSDIFTTLTSEIYHITSLIEDDKVSLREIVSNTSNKRTPVLQISEYLQTCKQINVFLTDCTFIQARDADSILSNVSKCVNTIDMMYDQLYQVTNTTLQKNEELTKYTNMITELSSGDTVESLTEKIEQLKNTKCIVDIDSIIIPECDYQSVSKILHQVIADIHNHTHVFKNECIHPKYELRMERIYQRLLYRVQDYGNNVNKLTTQIAELEQSLQQYPTQSTLTTICNECEYYSHFERQTKSTRDKLYCLRQSLLSYQKQYDKYIRIIEHYQSLYNNWKLSMYCVSSIKKNLDDTVLRLSLDQIVKYIKQDSNLLILYITNSINNSPKYYHNQKIDENIQLLESRLQFIISSSNTSVDMLKGIVGEKTLELNELKLQYHQILDGITTNKINQERYEKFLFYIRTLKKYQDQILTFTEYACLQMRIEIHSNILETKKEELLKIRGTLSELEDVIKYQDSLQDKIVDTTQMIKDIEIAKEEYEIIVIAISPYEGFPWEQFVKYLNSLIHNVNAILSLVWTYPLKLVPLDFSYWWSGGFAVQVDDVIVDDISKLSKAQQAMVDLAWMFAFVVSKKLMAYPLFLDECDDGFDPTHKTRLLEWLKSLISNGYTKQLFLVHHEAANFTFFQDSEVLALMSNNIVQCGDLNKHVTLS